jgi:hypothetical protein
MAPFIRSVLEQVKGDVWQVLSRRTGSSRSAASSITRLARVHAGSRDHRVHAFLRQVLAGEHGL